MAKKLNLRPHRSLNQYNGEIVKFLQGNADALAANHYSITVVEKGAAGGSSTTQYHIELSRQGDSNRIAAQVAGSVVSQQKTKVVAFVGLEFFFA